MWERIGLVAAFYILTGMLVARHFNITLLRKLSHARDAMRIADESTLQIAIWTGRLFIVWTWPLIVTLLAQRTVRRWFP